MTVINPINYTVGQAAQIAGTTRNAIRIYESKGLLPPAKRTAAGYRLFAPEDVEVLCFVRRARSHGQTLTEIRTVLDLQRGGAQPGGHVIRLLDAHLRQIEKTLSDLRQLRDTLRSARRAAGLRQSGGAAAICRIIETPQPGARSVMPLRPIQ